MATITNYETKAHTDRFIAEAHRLQKDGIHYNRKKAASLNIMATCMERAEHFLGKDINFVYDGPSVRMYIENVFGKEGVKCFEDFIGDFHPTIEHAMVFYYRSSQFALTEEHKRLVKGLFYFIAGHQLDDEFTRIAKVATKDLIKPTFRLSAEYFGWKKCEHIFRRYTLNFAAKEGYTEYFFEKPTLPMTSFLTYLGMSFPDADKTAKSMQGGGFFPFMPAVVENRLLPHLFAERLNANIMQGYYTPSYLKDVEKIEETYTISSDHNTYNFSVKPRMIEFMGNTLGLMDKDMASNPHLAPSDAYINHLSPQRIGLAVRDGVQLQEVLPTLHGFFNKVPEFSLDLLPEGYFI